MKVLYVLRSVLCSCFIANPRWRYVSICHDYLLYSTEYSLVSCMYIHTYTYYKYSTSYFALLYFGHTSAYFRGSVWPFVFSLLWPCACIWRRCVRILRSDFCLALDRNIGPIYFLGVAHRRKKERKKKEKEKLKFLDLFIALSGFSEIFPSSHST